MKKTIALLLCGLLLVPGLAACKSEQPAATTTTTPVGDQPADPFLPATAIDSTAHEEIDYFQNPVLSSRKLGYGLGDPFVMRYNGSYYLYITSTGTGILCWSSDDLVHWKSEGLCTADPVANGGYAPEVFYYNGMFYMYTSPKGNGHFVLSSKNPTGPFKAVTGNMGMSIDGSVFIDNDGKWYFYTAGGNAIQAYRMSSPTQMADAGSLNVTSMNGWTEGPMVVYHDGYYYMTYTGNHFESLSYRINYVVSTRGPLNFSAPPSESNPLLVCTDREVNHIGHNSTVKGPDLDSYYIAYHSMKDNGYRRDVNIDRIVFNKNRVEIMGPTTAKQQVPDLPDVYAYFRSGETMDNWILNGSFGTGGMSLSAGSTLLSNTPFSGDYTAEFNVQNIADGAVAGAIFSYTDAENFGSCVFDPASQKVIVTITSGGKSSVKEYKMIQSFKEDVKFKDCIQSIQIERSGNDYTFYMNDRELGIIKDSPLQGGAIGYIAQGGEASFGFIGGTGAVGGRGSADEYKIASELSGFIPANSYTTGSFPTATKDKTETVVASAGHVLNYRILAASKANYDLSALYFSGDQPADAQMEVYIDGQKITDVTLSAAKDFETVILRNIPLEKGQHTLSFKIVSGTVCFAQYEILKSEAVKAETVAFDQAKDGNQYTDGAWTIRSGELVMGNASSGKRLYGDRNWGDYTVEVEVTPGAGMNSGILVRATNPGTNHRVPTYAEGNPSADESTGGTDWLEGYYIGITGNKVILAKQSYSYRQLKSVSKSFKVGETHTLKVVCTGANLQVYVDGELCIDYTDDEPYLQGMVGLRTYKAAVSFDNLKITPNN